MLKSVIFVALIACAFLQSHGQCSFTVTHTITHETCDLASNGTISLHPNGSTLTYIWDDASTSANRTGLTIGNYTVSVTDGTCQEIHSFYVATIDISSVNYSSVAPSCTDKDGKVIISDLGWGEDPVLNSTNGTYFELGDVDSLSGGPNNIYFQDAAGCVDSVILYVAAPNLPEIAYSMTSHSCSSLGKLIFTPSTTGTPPFVYSVDGETFTTAPVFEGPASGYQVVVSDAQGCLVTETAVIESSCEHHNSEPLPVSRFSPNDDGLNDTWHIGGYRNYPNSEINVYNRWGHTVFSTKDYEEPWDGTSGGVALPAATYYYVIMLNSADASAGVVTGTVAIIR